MAAIDPAMVASMKEEGWLFADFPEIESQPSSQADSTDGSTDQKTANGEANGVVVADTLANLAVLPAAAANPYEGMDLDGAIEGHPTAAIGKRTRRFFRACANPMLDGIVVAFLPQGEEEDDFAMWKNWHQVRRQ